MSKHQEVILRNTPQLLFNQRRSSPRRAANIFFQHWGADRGIWSELALISTRDLIGMSLSCNTTYAECKQTRPQLRLEPTGRPITEERNCGTCPGLAQGYRTSSAADLILGQKTSKACTCRIK